MAAPNPVRIIPATSGNMRAGGEYVIRDEFTADRAAGAVNGTAAEPGPGVRVVVDTEGKITIAGGALMLRGREGESKLGRPAIFLVEIRRDGREDITNPVTPSQADKTFLFGILADTAGTLTAQTPNMILSSAGMRSASGTQENTFGAFATGTTYTWAIVLRATGCSRHFVKGGTFTYWTSIMLDICTPTQYAIRLSKITMRRSPPTPSASPSPAGSPPRLSVTVSTARRALGGTASAIPKA